MSGPYVYAIRSGDSGYIKIGAARDPWQRKKELQTGSPYELRIVGLLVGGFPMEELLHRDMATYHVRGEWFDDRDKKIVGFFHNKPIPDGYRWVTTLDYPFIVPKPSRRSPTVAKPPLIVSIPEHKLTRIRSVFGQHEVLPVPPTRFGQMFGLSRPQVESVLTEKLWRHDTHEAVVRH